MTCLSDACFLLDIGEGRLKNTSDYRTSYRREER